MGKNQRRPVETIAVRVAQLVRKVILCGEAPFEPGKRIPVNELKEILHVSATPLKEALKSLAGDGLIVCKPRRGFFVSELTERDLEEIISIREGLERWAMRLVNGQVPELALQDLTAAVNFAESALRMGNLEAFTQADMQFHGLITSIPGNTHLRLLYQEVMARTQISFTYWTRITESIHESINEHRLLISVLASGDLDKIDSAIAAHWVKARERMISGYRSYLANQRISLDILKRGDQARLEETIAGRNPDLGIAEPRRDRRREGGKRSLAAVEHER